MHDGIKGKVYAGVLGWMGYVSANEGGILKAVQ